MSVDERWYVYVVRCSDDTLYTGVTIDIDRRLYAHNSGKGARYTTPRIPVTLHYIEGPMTQSDALRREREIKGLSRADKTGLS